jgi:DNA polymerase III epsilon subunit-like protein
MDSVMDDPAFLAAIYVVIDFESLTPAGRPPVPVEVAAVAGRFTQALAWQETGRFQSLMRPPADVPVTRFDQAQTGLTTRELAGQPPAAQVMAALDARLARPPYRLVAHSAHTEATLIAGQREHCPVLAATSLLCTVRLSRAAFPELPSHSLDTVLRYLGIPVPPGRHRAMPDTELTVQVLTRALAEGHERSLWNSLRELDATAGIGPRPAANGAGSAPAQEALFLACRQARPGDLGEQLLRRQPHVLRDAGQLRQLMLRHPPHAGLRRARVAGMEPDEDVVQVPVGLGSVAVGRGFSELMIFNWCDTRSFTMSGRADRRAGPCGSAA